MSKMLKRHLSQLQEVNQLAGFRQQPEVNHCSYQAKQQLLETLFRTNLSNPMLWLVEEPGSNNQLSRLTSKWAATSIQIREAQFKEEPMLIIKNLSSLTRS